MQVAIYEEDGSRRVIGTLQDGVFTKIVKESKHLMQKFDAWGVDAGIFTGTLLSPQCSVILIKDREKDKWYQTLPRIMEKYGLYRHYIPHRAQMFLSRRYWVQQNKLLTPDEIKRLLSLNHIGT